MREFKTGATRDTDVGKNDYIGYLSPRVLISYGDYMTKHRLQADGKMRESDNWKKGMPTDVCLSSFMRHAIDLWTDIEYGKSRDGVHGAFGGTMFNLIVMWDNYLKQVEEEKRKK